MVESTDVVIVGAGPYGLSLSAHLRARGVRLRTFGLPMKFWRDMPVGVNLKSPAFGTSVSVPERGHSFDAWCRQHNLEDFEPCTMQTFATYGEDLQKRFVPQVEEVLVTNVAKIADGFEVTLANGARVRARQVVVATGLSYLATDADVLRGLPPSLTRHTADIADYSEFRNKTVAVIGGGASAVEAGALVLEAGGTAEVLARGPKLTIYGRTARYRPFWQRIKAPWTALGPDRRCWLMVHIPLFVHFLPAAQRIKMAREAFGPASPWWIDDRVRGKVPMHSKTQVEDARAVGNRVQLKVRDAAGVVREMEVDSVISGTGYVWDVARLPFLDRDLRQSIDLIERAPKLDVNFETSVKGLYFIGPISTLSFGPLMRFVVGADFTARSLTRHLADRRAPVTTRASRYLTTVFVAAWEKVQSHKAARAQTRA